MPIRPSYHIADFEEKSPAARRAEELEREEQRCESTEPTIERQTDSQPRKSVDAMIERFMDNLAAAIQPPKAQAADPQVINVRPKITIELVPPPPPPLDVKIAMPETEEITVVERDAEGFISRIRKRLRPADPGPEPLPPSQIRQIARESVGLKSGAQSSNG